MIDLTQRVAHPQGVAVIGGPGTCLPNRNCISDDCQGRQAGRQANKQAGGRAAGRQGGRAAGQQGGRASGRASGRAGGRAARRAGVQQIFYSSAASDPT